MRKDRDLNIGILLPIATETVMPILARIRQTCAFGEIAERARGAEDR